MLSHAYKGVGFAICCLKIQALVQSSKCMKGYIVETDVNRGLDYWRSAHYAQ